MLQEKLEKNREILKGLYLKKENLERNILLLEKKIKNQENALMNQKSENVED
jgi:hypothetical protein